MGMEQRGRTAYYYMKRRDGQRVISTYVGSGDRARLFAASDYHLQRAAAAERQAWAAERRRIEAADALIRARAAVLHDLTRVVLGDAGYHQHKGQWRKRRDRRTG
jgi:hypothetical protein